MEWSIIDGDELEPVRFQQNEQMSNTKKKLQFAPSLVNQWLLDLLNGILGRFQRISKLKALLPLPASPPGGGKGDGTA